MRKFIVFAVLCATQASAGNVLYFADLWDGTDYWTPAFALRGDTVTVAADANALVTQLAAGPWDYVVVAENNGNSSSTWAGPLATYISSGGKVVLNNWYANSTIDAAMEATAGSPTNQTTMTINAAGIATGLANGVANPLTLSNAGWANTYSQALTPTGTAESRCAFITGSCAVFGNSGRTMRLGFIPDGLPAGDGAKVLANAAAALFAAPAAGHYTVSGTASGLSGSMVVRLNGANSLTVSANGGFTFATTLVNATSYAVTVATPPAGQNCVVSNGSGTSSTNITNVTIACSSSGGGGGSANVPTLSEWAVMIFFGLMASGAFVAMRRRDPPGLL